MPEEQDVVKVVINKQSIFHLKELYEFMYNLVKALGYSVVEDVFTKKEDNVNFHWLCTKKMDTYTKYAIDITTKILNMKTIKTKHGELTETMDKANALITVKGTVITDWMNRYGINPQIKFIKGIMDKYIKGSSFDKRKTELINNVYLINNEISSYFEIPRFI